MFFCLFSLFHVFHFFGWCCCFSFSCLVVLPSFSSFGWGCVLPSLLSGGAAWFPPSFCDLEDGIQGARHGVPASAGLASSSGVGGSRPAEESEMLFNSQALDMESRRLLGWPRLLVLVVLGLQRREMLFHGQAWVRVSESLDCVSVIVHFSRHLARLLIIHEFMVSHLVFVLARCPALLLVFLLHRLRLVFVPGVVHCLLLLCRACLWMSHPCMVQRIQGVLVVCCLCANPPVTNWRWWSGSHAEEGFQRRGFRSGRRFASCLRGGGRVNFRPAGGIRTQVAGSLPGRQPDAGSRRDGRCGHTFSPPGGCWYPIRVTWAQIGHEAIDGLDEGVPNRTVGDPGAKG